MALLRGKRARWIPSISRRQLCFCWLVHRALLYYYVTTCFAARLVLSTYFNLQGPFHPCDNPKHLAPTGSNHGSQSLTMRERTRETVHSLDLGHSGRWRRKKNPRVCQSWLKRHVLSMRGTTASRQRHAPCFEYLIQAFLAWIVVPFFFFFLFSWIV